MSMPVMNSESADERGVAASPMTALEIVLQKAFGGHKLAGVATNGTIHIGHEWVEVPAGSKAMGLVELGAVAFQLGGLV